MARHRFLKGNKFSPGGKTGNKGGRPTREQTKLKRLVAEEAKKYIEARLGSVLDTYLSLATGLRVGDKRHKLDPATCRHAVERFVGQAPRTVNLDLQDSIETFFDRVMNESGQGKVEGKQPNGDLDDG